MIRKFIIFIFLTSFTMNNIYANADKIRQYSAQIDKSYKNTAKNMLLLSIMLAEDTTSQQVRLNKFILEMIGDETESKNNISYTKSFIFTLLNPASSDEEEIQILGKELSKLKFLKDDFLTKSIHSIRAKEKIRLFISSPTGFCSNKNYMQMMSVMDLVGEVGIKNVMESLNLSIKASYTTEDGLTINTKTDKDQYLVAGLIGATQLAVSTAVKAKVITFFGSSRLDHKLFKMIEF